MAYEYPSEQGVIYLLKVGNYWTIRFQGRQGSQWRSPIDAAVAVSERNSGLPDWDKNLFDASNDLVDWRPTGDSL